MTSATAILPEDVRQAVGAFWSAFAQKASLEEFYCLEASVFGSMASRVEMGRLAALRRKREYFHPETVIDIRITSPVDVVVRGEVAVATYSYEFHTRGARIGPNRTADEDITNGRVTHVLAREEDGKLRILHEHVSQADTWTTRDDDQNHAESSCANLPS